MTNQSIPGAAPSQVARAKILRSSGILAFVAALAYIAVSQAGIGSAGKEGRAISGRKEGKAQDVPVSTAFSYRGDLPVHLDGLGTVTAINSVTIRSRVDGELLRVHFTEGQQVNKGDLLAEIDPRPFEAQLAQAEGQQARDEALLDNARTDLQRYQLLLQQDSIASQQVSGQAALVRQYEAAVRMDKGQIAAIKLQLAYCRITSPVSGRAGLRQIDAGNVVRANDPNGLVVISQTRPIAAVFTLPEDKLPKIMGQLHGSKAITVEAFDRSGSTRLALGTLLAVDNQIDPATGTVKLKAVFSNDDDGLFANQFVNVRMNLEPLRGATLIPVAAVQRGSQGDFTYVVTPDSKVRLQTLTLGPREGELVAVLDGLGPDAQVVVEGTDRLRDGAAVLAAPSQDQKDGKSLASAESPAADPAAAVEKHEKHRP